MERKKTFPIREASRAALITALALTFPLAFHAVHLGAVFLPMFHPILAGAFFVPPAWAACAGVASPIISALLTGMPPLYPPVALWMAIELGSMGALTSLLGGKRVPVPAVLGIALFVGRSLYIGAAYVTALAFNLPAKILAGLSFFSGWPGIILSFLVVPPAVYAMKKLGKKDSAERSVKRPEI